ncbi:MAG TPA: signal recognition particle protein, partial [Eubacteriales bacterium]|nr:signal recognition particle protein [Eubacteriales bacterium]
EEVLKSLSPAQQVIKIVHEELIALLGSKVSKLAAAPNPPTVVLMCGLQGSGKTTMCGKLAYMLKKQGKNVMLAACDVYRPAAIKQLQILGEKVKAPVYSEGQGDPVKIAKAAVREAASKGMDILIVDTAGRLHIDDKLMAELKDIRAAVKPSEILLVIDAMTGQDAVNVADTFNKAVEVTGVVVTKLDGDTRGGAALSVKAVTGKPIKFIGTGEKIEDVSEFHPDRMASRILGMGDVLTLIEKAEQTISAEEAEKQLKRMRENSFTLEDYLSQIESIKKMGNIKDMLGMIPGMGAKLKGADADIDENQIKRTKAIIQSMTKRERQKPEIIKSGHKKRIALGSGTSIQEVNQLLKQFEAAKEMMARMAKGGGLGKRGGFPF